MGRVKDGPSADSVRCFEAHGSSDERAASCARIDGLDLGFLRRRVCRPGLMAG